MMKHADLVTALAKPGADIVAAMTAKTAHALHMAVGISGEVAELVQADRLQDQANRVEELGDIEFYFEGLRQSNNSEITEGPSMVLFSPKDETRILSAEALNTLVITSGAVLDVVKKIVVYNDPEKWNLLDAYLQELREALDGYYMVAGIDKKVAIGHNIRKLSKRYSKLTYSDLDARLRADKE